MDAHQVTERGIQELPGTLGQAIDELKADAVVCEALGDHVLEHYVEAKTAEWDEYRTQVTQWELDRYLEAF
jgi:glutamine synthetase